MCNGRRLLLVLLTDHTKILVNLDGRFVLGGYNGDRGLTERKIIVYFYGIFALHGEEFFGGMIQQKLIG